MKFSQKKKDLLARVDKSLVCEVDEQIKTVVDFLNSLDSYCTTSSCAGRIVVLDKTDTKRESKWLFTTHEPDAEVGHIHSVFTKNSWLLSESFILHVLCETYEHAVALWQIAYEMGLRKSGIIPQREFFLVQIIGNERVETPITTEAIPTLVEVANSQLAKNREKLKVFEEKIKKL